MPYSSPKPALGRKVTDRTNNGSIFLVKFGFGSSAFLSRVFNWEFGKTFQHTPDDIYFFFNLVSANTNIKTSYNTRNTRCTTNFLLKICDLLLTIDDADIANYADDKELYACSPGFDANKTT